MRHECHIEDGDDPQMQGATQLSWLAAEFLQQVLKPTQKDASVFLKNQAGGSEQDPFASTLEQGNSKARFQIAHLLGDGGLRNSKPVGRAAKAARLGHRQEVVQMANLRRIRCHRGSSMTSRALPTQRSNGCKKLSSYKICLLPFLKSSVLTWQPSSLDHLQNSGFRDLAESDNCAVLVRVAQPQQSDFNREVLAAQANGF